MAVVNNIKGNIEAAKKIRLPWWVLLSLGIASLPIYWLFDHFGRFNLALPTLNCILVLAFTIAVKWKLRPHAWFWSTMAIFATLHVPLILFVPWTTRWVPALAIAAIDSADLIVMLGVISVITKLMEELKT